MNRVIKTFLLLSAIAALILSVSCSGETTRDQLNKESQKNAPSQVSSQLPEKKADQLEPPKAGEEIAVMTTTMGVIKIRFFPDYAPKAVENFKTHAQNGYYDGLIFHRVINDFMIQGGDPKGTGTGGESIWGTAFEDEFSPYVRNIRGALSMANSGKNTNGSQFFIVQSKSLSSLSQYKSKLIEEAVEHYNTAGGGTPHLDDVHTVFGQVFDGMDVVDAIAATPVSNSKPVTDVKIEKLEIVKYE